MNRLREAANLPAADPADLPMTPGDVAQLVREGLFEIGGHTLTHPPLPLLDAEERRREIEEGKRRCEQLAGRKCAGLRTRMERWTTIAVPLCAGAASRGHARPSAGSVQRSSDPHALPRLFVQDWDGAAFEAALT